MPDILARSWYWQVWVVAGILTRSVQLLLLNTGAPMSLSLVSHRLLGDRAAHQLDLAPTFVGELMVEDPVCCSSAGPRDAFRMSVPWLYESLQVPPGGKKGGLEGHLPAEYISCVRRARESRLAALVGMEAQRANVYHAYPISHVRGAISPAVPVVWRHLRLKSIAELVTCLP